MALPAVDLVRPVEVHLLFSLVGLFTEVSAPSLSLGLQSDLLRQVRLCHATAHVFLPWLNRDAIHYEVRNYALKFSLTWYVICCRLDNNQDGFVRF
jgi:hypothetical protein